MKAMLRRRAALALAATGLMACAPAAPRPAPGAAAPVALDQPVTYAGEIPCADCPAQRVTLSLWPDGVFRLRRVYVGVSGTGDATFHDIGRWSRDGDRLRLDGGMESPGWYRFASASMLRMLDREGFDIRSSLNYDLARVPLDPVAGPMRLSGMYTYMADAASLEECRTGRRYPVLIEGEHLAVERAYLAVRRAPAEPVLADLEGEFVRRAPEPGLPEREVIRVTGFHRMLPGEQCAAVAGSAAAGSGEER